MSSAESMQADEDVALIERIARGDEQAMHQFFQRHHQSVYMFAMRRLNESADAADVLNDVMLQVWRNAGKFAGRSKVTTWLLGIANHKILDIYRRRGRASFDELDDSIEDENADDAESDIALAQDADMVKHCMDKLTEAHRQVVHLAFYEDMAYPDIAQVLECPPGTVKTRMMHAKKNLKRCLSALQPA
ncbi:MAG: sigma-70 family RNA polymerase sigma factor [Gammaproteobacteria bacterium]|jgi:RNA polymerase sigma-70 factor (ECF subfamily)